MRTVCVAAMMWLVCTGAHSQIGARVQQQSKIYGIWQNSQFGYQMTLMLNADGSGEFDGESIKFTTQGNQLSLTQAGQTTVYTYSLQGNSLILAGGDLDGSVTFTRNGAGQSEMHVGGTQPMTNAGSANQPIVGIWSGNGETIEFKEEGICNYLGNAFQYQLSPGFVTLVTTQGNVNFGYAVKGDQLMLSGNNKTVTYTRGANNNATQPTTGGQGQVAMELVGKWCWTDVNNYNSGASSSSTCITLNGDGTYQYYSESSRSVNTTDFAGGTNSQSSDNGTWWVQGDRIFYNSATRGQGSYRLEKRNHPKNVNDPMIVLDGEAYVTFYNKPPWR